MLWKSLECLGSLHSFLFNVCSLGKLNSVLEGRLHGLLGNYGLFKYLG